MPPPAKLHDRHGFCVQQRAATRPRAEEPRLTPALASSDAFFLPQGGAVRLRAQDRIRGRQGAEPGGVGVGVRSEADCVPGEGFGGRFGGG